MMMRPSLVAVVALLTLPLLLLVDGADPAAQHSDDVRALRRALQGGGDLGALTALCNDETGGVNLAENLSVLLAAADFRPNCTCAEENNIDDFNEGSFGGDGGFDIDVLNEFLSNLSIDIRWSCANGCATCNPATGVCGILTAGFTADFNGIPTNLTLEDLFSGAFSPDTGFGAFLEGGQTFELCMEYVSGGSLAGTTACAGNTLGIATFTVNATEQPCMLSYQGQECDSCVIQQNGCWVADCSIHGEPVVDSCTGTGTDSIFQVLAFYGGTIDRSTLTVGTCAGGDTPPSSPTESPLVLLTESPAADGGGGGIITRSPTMSPLVVPATESPSMAGNGTLSPTMSSSNGTTSMPVAAPTTTASPVDTSSAGGGSSSTNAPTDPPVSAVGSMLPPSTVMMVATGGAALWLLATFNVLV